MRNVRELFETVSKVIVTGALVVTLTACGGGSGSTGSASADDGYETFALSGSVGDGPVVNADVFIFDSQGGLMAAHTSDAFANYSLSFKSKGNPFPIAIEAIRGTDLVTGMRLDFTLKAVSLSRSQKRVNLNPFSTLIVEMARAMPGGFTATNVDTAAAIVIREMNFGLDTSSVPSPVFSEIDETNIANIVRASEALGELFRRTRTGLAMAGYIHPHNDIVKAISDDLVDGRLDGRGAAGLDARVSAVASVAASQILIEQFQNRLHVNGTLAVTAMDSSITQTLPTTPSNALTGSVLIPQSMVTQATRLLEAMTAIDARPELAALAQTVAAIPAGTTTGVARSLLNDDDSRLLDTTLTNVAQATDATLATLTTALSTDATTPQPAPEPEPAEEVNQAPTIAGTPATSVSLGSSYGFTPSAADADGDSLVFSIQNRPGWAAFNTSTGRLSGTPSSSHVGTYGNIVISVSDGAASASLPAFGIIVGQTNRAPIIGGQPQTAVVATNAYNFTPSASDADGDTLAFSIQNRPGWATFNSSTGRLSGTPSTSHVGSYGNIVISVTDGATVASLPAFGITVAPYVAPNSAPVINGTPAASVNQGAGYAFTPSASDADGDTLTFSVANRPSWTNFNTGTGRLSGTPSNGDVGSYGNITISVSDGTASASLPAFSIVVVDTNDAPTISGSPLASVNQGSIYAFTPSASDADGDSLTFTVSNRPAWMNFNAGTGRLTGTPNNSHVGTYSNIVVSVSDGTISASLPAFSITVVNVNDAPAISGTPTTSVDAGAAYGFTPSTMDLDGDSLTFSISNRPAWATFNSSTGRLSGTPTESNVGTYSNIVISVSDGQATAQLAPFSIAVNSTQTASRDVTLGWVAPATRADGSALSLSQIASFRIRFGTSPGTYTSSVNVDDSSATTYIIRDMAPATYYFVVTAIDTDGQESGYSGVVSTTVQ